MSNFTSRSKTVDISKNCKCAIHDIVLWLYPNLKVTKRLSIKSKDLNKAALNNLIDQEIFSKHANYICNLCIFHSKKLMCQEDKIDVDHDEGPKRVEDAKRDERA